MCTKEFLYKYLTKRSAEYLGRQPVMYTQFAVLILMIAVNGGESILNDLMNYIRKRYEQVKLKENQRGMDVTLSR